MRDPLRELERLTEFTLDAELSKLKDLETQVLAARKKVADLTERRAARGREVRGLAAANDLSRGVGQDAKWQGWVAAQIVGLNASLAQLAAKAEAQRLKARHAFGRVEAVSKLRARGLAVQNASRDRQAADNGVL